MPRINRRARTLAQPRRSRAQVLELLLGPNGASVFRSDEQMAEVWQLVSAEISPEFAEQWHAGGNRKNYAAVCHQYARDVVAGKIPACIYVRQACARHLDDLEKLWEYRFDSAKADRVCRFIEMLPHVKGVWASKEERIALQPWQVFIICSLFGWVNKLSVLRRFTLAYEEVARKNAKSTQAAGIGLYMFACDGEFGAEVYAGATSEGQAQEVFRPARQMMERSPELMMALGVTPPGPNSKRLAIQENGSRFETVIGKPGDGASPHCGIVDEYHEHDSDVLFDTFRTGMGARQQPLELVITTAGDNMAGPCKLLREDVIKVLDGTVRRDEVFAIIFTMDESRKDAAGKEDLKGEKWSDELALVKANPNLDVSVFRSFLVAEREVALVNPRKRGVFQTKHLCVWVGAMSAFFDKDMWVSLGDPKLKPEDFIGCTCVLSIDLSKRLDFTARALGFKKIIAGKEHYFLFMRFRLPQAQILRPECQHYFGWAESKYIEVHEGAVVDFMRVQAETEQEIKRFKAKEFAYDDWNAEQFGQAIGQGTKAVPVELDQNVKMLNAPMKELEALIIEGRVHHDGNPVMNWMMGNVTAREDANENVMPRKEPGREENKIDGAVAAIMVISRLMVTPTKKSVYATRGLISLGSEARI